MTRRFTPLLLPACVVGWACSSPEFVETRFPCSSDEECQQGEICAPSGGQRTCEALDTSPIAIGMSGPFVGPSQDLGNEMRRGIQAMLKRVNDAGGIFGRPLELRSINDGYDPGLAVEATRQLLDVREVVHDPDQPDIVGDNGVFALLGNIGTPTMLATAPLATKNQTIFFAPFTGSQQYLRDDTRSPYVYNYRVGYFDETAAMVEYLRSARIPSVISNPATDYERLVVFAQNDSFGDAGYQGVVTAYNRLSPLPDPEAIARVGYTREEVESVDPAVDETAEFLTGLLERGTGGRESAAIIMIDTYLPGNRFIRKLKNWVNADLDRATRLDLQFLHVSFVGSDSLASALSATPESYSDVTAPGSTRRYSDDVIVTQVVPYYGSQAAGVARYRDDIRAYDDGPLSFTSLEGYVATRVFTEALQLHGPHLTTETFLQTLDTRVRDLDIGIGTRLSFSSTNHQACDTVWGSRIEADGTFSVPFVWRRGEGIVTLSGQ